MSAVVPKLFEHTRLIVGSELSRPAAWAVSRAFGVGVGACSEQDALVAQNVLDGLRNRRLWLACGCNQDADGNRPLMYPSKLQGALYLRYGGEIAHATACPLHRAQIERPDAEEPQEASGGQPVVLKQWEQGWNLATPTTGVAQSMKAQLASLKPHQPRTASYPRLGRLLLSVLDRTQINQVSVGEVFAKRGEVARALDPKGRYALLDRLNDDVLAPGLTWKDIRAFTLPVAVKLLHRLHDIQAKHGSRSYRAQGYFMGIVDEIESCATHSSLTRQTKEGVNRLRIDGPIAVFGRTIGVKGPYWLLAHALQPASGGRFTYVRAYAHPVFSPSLPLPVDSGLERQTIDEVLHALKGIAFKNPGLEATTLVKPTLDADAGAGEYCRPDLIVQHPDGRRLVVECMGDDDPEYLASKAITHPRMARLPGVVGLVQYRPGHDDPGVLTDALRAFLIPRNG